MSNVFVEGFGTYGTGAITTGNSIYNALLAGVWAQIGVGSLGTLPWDANSDIYLGQNTFNTPNRVALAAGVTDPLILSVYYAVNELPLHNNDGYVVAFLDNANAVIAKLICQSTGVMQLLDSSNNVLLSTAAPVIVAETATHLEMKITVATGAFQLKVNEVSVMSGSGMTFTGASHTAQLGFINGPNGSSATQYVANIIVRDTNGSVNNDFVGDRRVATLFVNADDVSHQGWAGQARHRFGNAILDNRASTSAGVKADNSSQTDLGSADWTIEGSFRLFSFPGNGNKGVLFQKWDETANKRSYQLYLLGGATTSANTIVFRVSTDGTSGTVTQIFSWPWVPSTNSWHHIAVVRASSEVLLFIDGVQQGLPNADAHTYYAGTEVTSFGCQCEGSTNAIANTAFTGFIDELRLTVGVARYTSGFTPPSAAFPRGSGSDPNWANVALLCGFENGLADDSSYGRTLTSVGASGGAVVIIPNDGTFNYQTLDKPTPFDDTFVEAALIPATSILTQTANPATTKTFTVGTKDGSTPAVYTWKTSLSGSAFEVKIGATVEDSLNNAVAAINAAAGAGTLYGTGTTANFDVTAARLPVEQLIVTANTPGTGGNSIATSTNDTNGSWTGSHLAGGVDIPSYSQFGFDRPPNETTVIDSVTLVGRTFKTDSGTCNVQMAFVGSGGGVEQGGNYPITTTPTYYRDTFEADPDTTNPLTPSSIISGKVRLNRTA